MAYATVSDLAELSNKRWIFHKWPKISASIGKQAGLLWTDLQAQANLAAMLRLATSPTARAKIDPTAIGLTIRETKDKTTGVCRWPLDDHDYVMVVDPNDLSTYPTAAMPFLMAHELAHIVNGDLEAEQSALTANLKHLNTLRLKQNDNYSRRLHETLASHSKIREYKADQIAMTFFSDFRDGLVSAKALFAELARIDAADWQHFRSVLGANVELDHKVASHPLPDQRLARLKAAAPK